MVNYYISTDGSTWYSLNDYVITVKISRNAELTKNRLTLDAAPTLIDVYDISKTTYLKVVLNGSTLFKALVSKYVLDEGKTDKLRIEGFDASMDFFAAQRSVSYTSKTATDIIIDLASKFSGKKHPIVAQKESLGGYIYETSTVIDNFYGSNKRFYDYMIELSQPEYTGVSNSFNFYIDEENNLHWEPFSVTVSNLAKSMTISAKPYFSPANRFNHVVINCGTDWNGDRILAYYVDIYGYKLFGGRLVSKYFDETRITDDLKKVYDSSQNETLISEANSKGVQVAKAYIERFGKAKKQLDVLLPITTAYAVGSRVSTDIPIAKSSMWKVITVEFELARNAEYTRLILEEVV